MKEVPSIVQMVKGLLLHAYYVVGSVINLDLAETCSLFRNGVIPVVSTCLQTFDPSEIYRSAKNRKTENSWLLVPYSIKANLFCEQHDSYVCFFCLLNSQKHLLLLNMVQGARSFLSFCFWQICRDFSSTPLDHYLTLGQKAVFQSLELQEVPMSLQRLSSYLY